MWTYVVHGFPEKLQLVLGHGADLHRTLGNLSKNATKISAKSIITNRTRRPTQEHTS